MRSKPSPFETLCDILYLLIMIALSVNLLLKDGFGNPESRTYHLAGFMVVILILGDSFRFIPRITSFFIKDSDNVELVQDKGKIISSIVITFFLCFSLEFRFHNFCYKCIFSLHFLSLHFGNYQNLFMFCFK